MRVRLVIITSAYQRCSLFQPSIIRFTSVTIYKENDRLVSGNQKQIFTNKANGNNWVQAYFGTHGWPILKVRVGN